MIIAEKIDDMIAYIKFKAGRKKYYYPKYENLKKFSQELINFGINNEKYSKLIANLDDNSIKTINKILDRVKFICTNNDEKVEIYDFDEKIILNRLKHQFFRKIKTLNNGNFSYKNYILPINHFETSVIYYECGINTFDDLSDLKNRSIIDVGGFIGDSALIFKKYSNAPLYVFEPNEDNFNLLLETIKLNDLKNIVPEKYALGDKEAFVSISNQGSGSSISQDSGQVKQITLDSYVKKHNIDVGLIKADVEGYEKYLLLGAKETILKQRPKLLISMYHNYEQFFGLKPMIEEMGYKCKIIHPTDGNIFTETTIVAEPV